MNIEFDKNNTKIIKISTNSQETQYSVKSNRNNAEDLLTKEELEKYFKKVESLNGLRNKKEFLDRKASYHISNGLLNIIDAIEMDNLEYTIEKYGYLMIVNLPNGRNKLLFGSDYGLNSSVIRRVFDDKIFTNYVLSNFGIKVPKEFMVIKKDSNFSNKLNSSESTIEFAKTIGFPLIVKPLAGMHGNGVNVIDDENELRFYLSKFDNGEDSENKIIIQEFIYGVDHRILYLNGRVIVVYKRLHPFIVGDGKSTIKDLIDELNFDEKQKNPIENYLNRKLIYLNSIPGKGKKLLLLPNANLSTGGKAELIKTDKETNELMRNISMITGANYFGADIISNGNISDGTIIELNKCPGISGVSKILPGFKNYFGKLIWNSIKQLEGISYNNNFGKLVNTYEEALENIFHIEKIEDYTLDKMKIAITLLGNPLKDIKVVHLAGTNGKGSVAKMVFSILKKAGYPVGVFTSPHLIDIRERFSDHKSDITKKEFVEVLNEVLSLPLELSYFEKCTLISFLFFKKRKLEYAVVEVGLGGLLDCTNVVEPTITAITSIGIDHTDYLGNTIEEISEQKAGIIKPGVPVIVNHKNKVIENIAKEKKSDLIFTKQEYDTSLIGEHQRKNAGIAYEIGKHLGIDDEIILKGLNTTEHKGRLQYITSNLLIDGAHNEDGLKELKKYVDFIKHKYKKIYYCFSIKKGKNISLISNIFGKNKNYIFVKCDNYMTEKEEIVKKQMEEQKLQLNISSSQEIRDFSERKKDSLFLIFGSLYMIGEFVKKN